MILVTDNGLILWWLKNVHFVFYLNIVFYVPETELSVKNIELKCIPFFKSCTLGATSPMEHTLYNKHEITH